MLRLKEVQSETLTTKSIFFRPERSLSESRSGRNLWDFRRNLSIVLYLTFTSTEASPYATMEASQAERCPYPRDPRSAILSARALGQRTFVVDSASIAVQAPVDLQRMETYLMSVAPPQNPHIAACFSTALTRLYGSYHILSPSVDAILPADTSLGDALTLSNAIAVYSRPTPGTANPDLQLEHATGARSMAPPMLRAPDAGSPPVVPLVILPSSATSAEGSWPPPLASLVSDGSAPEARTPSTGALERLQAWEAAGQLRHALLQWPPPPPEAALTSISSEAHTVCTIWLPLETVADDALGAFMRDAVARKISGQTFVKGVVRARATIGTVASSVAPSAGGSTLTQPVPMAHDADSGVTVSMWVETVPGLQGAYRILPDQPLPAGFYETPTTAISSTLAEAPIHVRWRAAYAAAAAAPGDAVAPSGGPGASPRAPSGPPLGAPGSSSGGLSREIALLEDEVGRWLNTRHMALVPQYMAETAATMRLTPTRGCRAGYVIVTQSTSDTR